MEMTNTERADFETQLRYVFICQQLRWDAEYRLIGMLLLLADGPLSRSCIAKKLNIPRSTVVRKVQTLIDVKCARSTEKGVEHTEVGRAFHLTTHREILEVARGEKDGFSPELVAALMSLPTTPPETESLKKVEITT